MTTKTPKPANLSTYGTPSEYTRVQEVHQTVKESRSCMYGLIPIDALKVMDKRRFSVVADATLDEVVATIEHLFANVTLCDTCEEPATRTGVAPKEDLVDASQEYACDTCKFSTGVKNIQPTSAAESIHRAKSMILMLKDRR